MDLVIGETSQLFPYFREYNKNIKGISSRNIDFEEIEKNLYDNVFLTFAEQRTFLAEDVAFFSEINVKYTLEVIHRIKKNTKKIVVYLTSELWNLCSGEIDLSTPFSHTNSPYIKSKEILKYEIDKLRESEDINIQVIYPFNFNSPYRKEGFLFSKFLSVIRDKAPVHVGDLDFYRDMVTPKMIVESSYASTSDVIVGSGLLINVKQFYSDLLNHFNIDYNEYVLENRQSHINNRGSYYLKTQNKYNNLLTDTIYDIEKFFNRIS